MKTQHTNLKKCIEAARNYSLKIQRPDGHWVGELESNTTITAEYIFLLQALGLPFDRDKTPFIKYLLSKQNADGSWGIAHDYAGDVSTTAETYLALRLCGVDQDHTALRQAQEFILQNGGLEKIRVFTRINFALFGLFPWSSVPSIPPEFMFLPPQSPINIYRLSSWARSTMVPLFIIFHHKPTFALPNGCSRSNAWLDHLWINPNKKNIPYIPTFKAALKEYGWSLKTTFIGSDVLLKALDRAQSSRLARNIRKHAVKACEDWVLEHQEVSGDWAGIFPPMVNGVLALYLNGHKLDSPPVKQGLEALDRFIWRDKLGARVEACQSPVWDTALSLIGHVDSKTPPKSRPMQMAARWLESKRLDVTHGDWRIYNTSNTSGGWSFEYENSWYPDVDDTAAVVLALMKQNTGVKRKSVVTNAVKWMVSMQNSDGGFAAFDIDNDHLYLNDIPFSDMDSLCDPSSPDVTGRVIEALGLLNSKIHLKTIERAVRYLLQTQEAEGPWFGRWGVNYIYGTSNVLCGLRASKSLIKNSRVLNLRAVESSTQKAVKWLVSKQNDDGGWGECLESYKDRSLMGQGTSSASQTAWALMALEGHLPKDSKPILYGIDWLIRNQSKTGTWKEPAFTGTGFPNHFYLKYHLYCHYFPMMALGRFVS